MNSYENRALILDDEYLLGEILANALIEEGIDSVAVTDVDAAIDNLEKQTFDIVISDIYLPEKNGQDLFNYAQQHHPALPFIFITGNPNLETAINFLKNGAYDYLQKPFMLPELISKVKEVINKSQQRQQEKNLVQDLKQLLNQRVKELHIYQDIFETKKDGLLILDTEGIIVRVNPGLQKMIGMDENRLINQPISILNQIITPPLNFSEIRGIITRRGEWKEEIRSLPVNGGEWIANCSIFPILNEAGHTFAYSALINDVTGLRRVEKALIDSLRKTNLAHEAIIFGLARLAEYRDRETGYHLEKIRSYSKELALALHHTPQFRDRVTEKFIDTLYRAAPLHDIGKVGIPDYILLKQGKLTPDEYEIMRSHTLIGYQTLNSIRQQYGEMDFLNMGIEITYCHHERFDGKGYPRGLAGKQIPLSAQIVAIADVYDALTSRRVYKKAFPHEVAVNTMKLERGLHFDPEIFDVFLASAENFDRICREFRETEEEHWKIAPPWQKNVKSA